MALIPPGYLNTVVALGSASKEGAMQYTATGFLYGYPSGETNESGAKMYRVYLVTNRHVYEKAAKQEAPLQARLNRPMGTVSKLYSIPLKGTDGSDSWFVHPDPEADVAVLPVNTRLLEADGIEFEFFAHDVNTFTLAQAREIEVSEGDGVFVLGFPLGEAGDERNYVVARQGIMARVQDWAKGNARTFLIDASVFPGNSGGPVLLKPELTSITGTKRNDRCGLIGMVSSYMPYREIAISVQTERPRMIFEENSGLAIVVPPNVIQEAVEVAFNGRNSTGESAADLQQVGK
ncbi:MAG: trypsin-like peptidase domain-containing protein [Dehalococcoidia bacterium]|nr:trypsin-like peptidase domain-containing protein [Dehalococcoidia bacterium]